MNDTPLNHPDRLLRLPAVESAAGFRKTWIYAAVQRGEFPRPAKIGRASAWSEAEVRAWVEARKAERSAA